MTRAIAVLVLILCSPALATQYQFTAQEYDLMPMTNPATGDTITGDIIFWNGLVFDMQWSLSGPHGASDITLPEFTQFGGTYTLTDTQMILNANDFFNYTTFGGGGFQIVTDNHGEAQIGGGETWVTDLATPFVLATYSHDVTLTFQTDPPDPIWPGTNPAGNGGLFPEGVINPHTGGGGPITPEPSTLCLTIVAMGWLVVGTRRRLFKR
jgi:hypothetical protein